MTSDTEFYTRLRRILVKLLARLPVTRQVIKKIRTLQHDLSEREARIVELESQITNLERRLSGIEPQDIIINFFELMKGQRSEEVCRIFHRELAFNYDLFSESIGKHLPSDDLLHMLSLLLIPVARNGLKDQETGTRLFHIAQSMDVHLLPVHYYSPVPDTSRIPEWNWEVSFDRGYDLNVQFQLNLLDQLSEPAMEMKETSTEADTTHPGEFFWNNPAFGPMDAAVYYSMIRHFKPERVLEVGGGYSTMVAVKAAKANGNTIVDVVEPYPHEFLRDGSIELHALHVAPVQEIPIEEFEILNAGDILFIDSTHICKSGSDVNWILLNILPRLASGVIVHFHDITIPWDYPREWVLEKRIFYNEQFLLLAYLIENPNYEVLLANYYLGEKHQEELQKAFPYLTLWGGGSFWIHKVGQAE